MGKAITPPEGLFASVQPTASPMPTATALAVATITAQLQAKDVETNAQPVVVNPAIILLTKHTEFFSLFQTPSQVINNPLSQVNFIGGPIAPTTIAAAISAASYSGTTAVTSSKQKTSNREKRIPK